MLLLSCTNLSRGFDAEPLFEDLGFELYHGQRVALVGPNGVGKTTLMRILAGLDTPDTGAARLHAGARAALLQQTPDFVPGRALFDEAKHALDALVAAHDDMVHTAEQLATAQTEADKKSLAARYDRLNELLRWHDAYNVDHRVEQVLDGLGFSAADYPRPVETFSGGQQSRLMLAKLLLSAPDVLLLDEPSNHLDIDGLHWLEAYLVEQHEAMLIVSHDRYFLDRVATRVFEMSRAGIEAYTGNYQHYWRQRQERHEQEVKAWQAQQEYIEKQEEYIRRVHYGQLHKQAQSRRKSLDRLERVERPVFHESPHMHFGQVRRTGDIVFRAENLAKSYDKPLFRDVSFAVARGKRVGILGPNGSGKTTLLKILLGEVEPDAGKVERGHQVEIGYYDQQLHSLPPDQPAVRAVWPEPPLAKDAVSGGPGDVTEQAMRDLLGRFGVTGDQVYQLVGKMSGGEKSRVALARLVALGVNVLVLDEPTNHLDLWALSALEQALLEYEGTVLVVSHDRYFLNRVVDQLIVLESNGQVRVIHGNYDTYERMRALTPAPRPEAPKRDASTPPAARAERPEKGKRKRRFPYRKVADLEQEIAGEETRLRELESLLAMPDLYRDGAKVKDTTRDFEETKARLAQLYEHWEEAVELS